MLPISNHNPLSSQIYMGNLKRYSLQLEALFLINQIYLDDPFKYSAYPLLKDNEGNMESVEGKLIEQAYEYYRDWFEKVKSVGGLDQARKAGLVPLRNAQAISWYN